MKFKIVFLYSNQSGSDEKMQLENKKRVCDLEASIGRTQAPF